MSTTKLETKPNRVSKNFEDDLPWDNVTEPSRLVDEGKATLRVSVYPWGAEFEVVATSPAREVREGNVGAFV